MHLVQTFAFPQQMGTAHPMSPKVPIPPVRPPTVMDGNAIEIRKNASMIHADHAPAFIHRLVGGIRRGGCVLEGLPSLAHVEEVDQGAGTDGA